MVNHQLPQRWTAYPADQAKLGSLLITVERAHLRELQGTPQRRGHGQILWNSGTAWEIEAGPVSAEI